MTGRYERQENSSEKRQQSEYADFRGFRQNCPEKNSPVKRRRQQNRYHGWMAGIMSVLAVLLIALAVWLGLLQAQYGEVKQELEIVCRQLDMLQQEMDQWHSETWNAGGAAVMSGGNDEVVAVETESESMQTEGDESWDSAVGTVEVQDETEETEQAALNETVMIDSMTLEEKVAQLFVITPEALTGVGTVTAAGAATEQAINNYPVGGLVYFRDNIQSEEQFSSMVQNVQEYSKNRIGLPMLIGVDEEGGTVTRIGGRGFPGVEELPDMYSIGMACDTEQAYQTGREIGSYLKRFQINVDFAPVADIWSNQNNSVIGTRSFGNDADLVADMVAAEVKGLREQGICATLKHFPGHGDTEEDSHAGAANSWKTLEELRACEFLPFEAGIEAGAEIVMAGHISVPNVTGDYLPASLSYTMITEILRNELKFDGVVITDAMNMGAITNVYGSGEAAVKAIQAGIDLILMPGDFYGAYSGVLEAVKNGTISTERLDESVERIFRLKQTL